MTKSIDNWDAESGETCFESWGLLELFGRQRLAGRISDQTIGGVHFLRIDVPEVDGTPGYSRFFTQGAIYGMTPMEEAVTRALARRLRATPVDSFTLREIQQEAQEQKLLELTQLMPGSDLECGTVLDDAVVRKVFDFGALVELRPGVDGLLHISQIAHQRVDNVADYLAEGQVVKVKVIETDEKGRVKLSMKALLPAPANDDDDDEIPY